MSIQKQSGFAHLAIITIILAVGLVGALGFVFYQNFIQDKNVVTDTNVDIKIDDTDKTPVVANEGYLVLEDWGVKFKLPSDIGTNKITYQKATASDSSEYYYISTERVSTFGGTCDKLFQFYRSEEQFETTIGAPSPAGKVGVYYYGFQGPQVDCSNTNSGKDIQNEDYALLRSLLTTVEAK